MKRNPHIAKLPGSYLFNEIGCRKEAYLKEHPTANLISLGIGDTTEPLPAVVSQAMAHFANTLSTPEGYTGYGSSQGWPSLREAIIHRFYPGLISADELTLSDGAKCDLGRLAILFGSPKLSVAIQDPSYPVYIDTSRIVGRTRLKLLPCKPGNKFFPKLKPADIIYICSPNNPTGAAYTTEQLTKLVTFAKENNSLIIYDSAYAAYIQSGAPRSIYEIPGAKEVAIEVSSFSKLAGFTGTRLGWTIVPHELIYSDGHSVLADWNRIINTFFNGPSNIAQAGGLAALSTEGWDHLKKQIQYYLTNARTLKSHLDTKTYGGIDAPYIWAHYPNHSSWDLFDYFLNEHQIITTPGVGFGPAGEHFIRLSAFGSRETIEEAATRLKSSSPA